MSKQLYRMRTPSTGREFYLEAEPDRVYIDRDTGESVDVVGKVLPAAPSKSSLPWMTQYLRFCDQCDQLCQRDLEVCPTCESTMEPLPERA